MAKSHIKKAAEIIKPSSFLDYKEYLTSLYRAVKKEVGRYSYTKFAEDLGFSATNIIHQFIQGYRPLTPKTASKIAAAIPVRGVERKYLVHLSELHISRSAAKKERILSQLLELKKQLLPNPIDRDMVEYYSSWYHSVIREMVRLENFKSQPEWIARRVQPRIDPDQAKGSLEVLERLGLVEFDQSKNRHVTVKENVSTGHETSGMEIMNYHSQMIDIGRDALTRVPPEERDYSVVTVCISNEKIQKLKSMIHKFQMELLGEEDECDTRDHVYQVNIQMFPFTK